MDAEQQDPLPDGSLLAAIDLGSNSFHLIIAKTEHGEMRPVEVLAEKVQLGAGLIDDRLTQEAIDRGLDCLSRFAQLLGSVEPQRIRVVGTNALRQAENRLDFTLPAREILGTRVDVIYGREEARLVYLGVAHTLADDANSRLVIDIGGGSTEFIIGQRFEPQKLESLQIGCVSFSSDCFANGVISAGNYQRAYNRARLETSQIRYRYGAEHWAECVGSSGTLNAIESIVVVNGWSETGITRKALVKLEKKLLKFGHFDEIKLNGLNESRRNVIVAGVAITSALFDILGIEQMRTSKGALREGVIYDLMGRLSHEDVRERTVNALVQRYAADEPTAAIVERRCATFFSATRGSWELENEDWELLHWAARTHEIGMAISHKHFNRHTAYLLRNADLPGFSQEEQEQLAILTEGLRGKITPELLVGLPKSTRGRLRYLLTIIRLAVCFKHVETLEQLPEFGVQAEDDVLSLGFPEDWLEAHPLTHSELMNQQEYLGRIGIELNVS
ncbi:Ppx/GppA family phosphatase [Seongchinamella unica]|uniref:Ppx/GppA family phosphatase n=1 Tax=Seongchinamella unica TaxID=2547392 RepID=A0A4R5LP58_9GAMM|nr:Ppx/GppA phosphatase family protein [Seongchinamella unica]TDG12114.1 Ppx/GppA family phosphatase [Seongchinamella unica]